MKLICYLYRELYQNTKYSTMRSYKRVKHGWRVFINRTLVNNAFITVFIESIYEKLPSPYKYYSLKKK